MFDPEKICSIKKHIYLKFHSLLLFNRFIKVKTNLALASLARGAAESMRTGALVVSNAVTAVEAPRMARVLNKKRRNTFSWRKWSEYITSSLTFFAKGSESPRRAGAPEWGDAGAPVLAAGVAKRCKRHQMFRYVGQLVWHRVTLSVSSFRNISSCFTPSSASWVYELVQLCGTVSWKEAWYGR